MIVVAAFGQMLRPDVLNLPPVAASTFMRHCCLAGGALPPVQAAILAGDQVTGSTIMRMDEGMDTRPIWRRLR